MRMFLPFGLALISFNAYTAECVNTKYESEMYECFKEKLNEQDKLLNQTYNKLLNTYKSDGPLVLSNVPSKDVYLKKAQLAWIKTRDTSCDYETYESNGGTGFSTIYEKCLLDKTVERIQYLKDQD